MQQSSYCSARSPTSGNSCSSSSSSSGSFPEAVSGSPSATESSSSSDRYKTELCRSFEEGGTCRYGTKCRFAHGRWEMRPLDRHPKYKTEFCRTYHSSGFCPYGQRCHFIHGDQGCSPPLDAPPVELPGAADERGMFGEGVVDPSAAFEARGNGVDLQVTGCGTIELFQGFQGERRPKSMEVRECGLEGQLASLRRKLDVETRMRFIELEKHGPVTADELKERFHHHSSISSSSSRLDPRRLELELSALLQRRRSQLRCNSVGSGCETPPPSALPGGGTLDSRTSSPMSSEETRSPMLIAGSPPYSSSFLLRDVLPLPRSPLRHHDILRNNNNHTTNRFTTRASSSSAATVSNISEHKDRLPFSLWSSGDGGTSARSVSSGLDSPHRRYFHSPSSGSLQPSPGPYFVFDAETLARLIRR